MEMDMNDRPTTIAVAEILKERGKTHGVFDHNAILSQRLKHCIYTAIHDSDHGPLPRLSEVQCEALDMICLKISRIATGDPNFRDHWNDIAGYARLAADRCPAP